MRSKPVIAVGTGSLRHHGVNGFNHLGGVAARVVAGEQIAPKPVPHKRLRCAKNLRLGAPEAVDALLRVADQKHAGRTGRAHRSAIALQPRRQRLPLQRVGVLKLVDQQMPNARIKPLLHPAREHRVGQHEDGGALNIVHVDPAAPLLERGELGQQHAREPGHALLILPSRVLAAGGEHAQHQLLRGAHLLQPDDLVAELARRAGGGQQRGDHSWHVAHAKRLLQLDAAG